MINGFATAAAGLKMAFALKRSLVSAQLRGNSLSFSFCTTHRCNQFSALIEAPSIRKRVAGKN
jgi:hypothetical protein